jgi:hypothetical protein
MNEGRGVLHEEEGGEDEHHIGF